MNARFHSSDSTVLNDAELVILVVEDNDQDFFLVQRQLRQSREVRFLRVTTVAEGLVLLGDKNVDIVLLDLSLPDSKGLDTVSHIVSHSSAPVVVLTATEDERTGLEALACGAQDYLVKGNFDNALLTRAIRYAVERYKLQDELQTSKEAIRRERELRRYQSIDTQEQPSPGSQSQEGQVALRERGGTVFKYALDDYARILDHAIEQRGFKVEHHIPERLKKLAEALGSWRAAPRDILDIHTTVLASKLDGMETGKSRVCTEEGRYLLTGILGHLCNFYSAFCSAVPEPVPVVNDASNDSDME